MQRISPIYEYFFIFAISFNSNMGKTNYRKGGMKGLKFLILFLLWCTATYLTFLILYFNNTDSAVSQLERQGSRVGRIFRIIAGFFEYADSWNYLSLVVFVSILLFLFAVNDLLTEKYFKTRTKSRSFIRGGMIWLGHKTLALILVFFQFILISNLLIIAYGWMKTVSIEDIEEPKAVLVLGTNKQLRSRPGENVYFYQRMDAAAELYKAGKARKIYVSGDNSREDYNEPLDMKRALMKRGVPASKIELDYAGFRTLDSVVRLKYHFGIPEAVIVSQRFQVERALALARYYEIDPLGYPSEGSMTLAMFLRETLAKPRVLMDIFLFNTQPRFGRTKSRAAVNVEEKKEAALVFAVVCLFIISGMLTYRTLEY
jgi:SanA protein